MWMKWVKWGLGGLGLFLAAGVVTFGVISIGRGNASAQAGPFDFDAVFGGVGAVAFAGPGEMRGERFNELLAQKLGITVEQLEAAEKAARDQLIDEAVAEGRLTAEQGAKLKSMELGALRGPFLGKVGPGIVSALKNVFTAAAEVIGITNEQLKTELQSGKSLADIAESHNVDRDDLVDGIVDSIEGEIAQAVSNGRMTQEQANRLLENLEDRVEQAVDHEGGLRLELGNGGLSEKLEIRPFRTR
jgi:polyhydroxyalkanoate synthesis regulator phasin